MRILPSILFACVCAATSGRMLAAERPLALPLAAEPGVVQGMVSIADSGAAPDLSRVVIYLASHPELDRIAPDAQRPVMAQRNKAFIGDLLAISRGTTVEFPNQDPYSHNVFSRSRAASFDLDRYPAGQSKSYQFNEVGIVQLFCNIHPQMKATIVVVPNKFFTRADRSGKFRLSAVPLGAYDLVAWHERCDEQRQPIRVEPGGVDGVVVAMQATRGRAVSAATVAPSRRVAPGVERGLGVKRERLNLPVIQELHAAPNP